MATIVVPADSTTLTLNGHLFNSFAEGDFLEIAPVNPSTSHINGVANDSVTINQRSDRNVHDLTIRVMRHDDDDIYLNDQRNSEIPPVFSGTMKTNFTKNNTDFVETWLLENGSLTDQPTEVKNSQDGNALMEYKIRFRSAQRQL